LSMASVSMFMVPPSGAHLQPETFTHRISDRSEGNNQIERNDGARFNFTIQVGYPARLARRKEPEIISYHFNMAFREGHQPLFIRFDLNEANFVKGGVREAVHSPLLCHMHPGHGKMTVPSMVLSPQEVLDILLRGHLR
jgi:hypothetical protein